MEFHRFLQMAMGSASEAEYHLLLARDLQYFNAERYETLNGQVTEVKRMLAALLQRVNGDRQESRQLEHKPVAVSRFKKALAEY